MRPASGYYQKRRALFWRDLRHPNTLLSDLLACSSFASLSFSLALLPRVPPLFDRSVRAMSSRGLSISSDGTRTVDSNWGLDRTSLLETTAGRLLTSTATASENAVQEVRDSRSKAFRVRVIIRGILFACRGHRDSDPPPNGKSVSAMAFQIVVS